jgi:ubiquinone biosynthesis protein Coq4
MKITKSQLKSLIKEEVMKHIVEENYQSPSNFEDKWYSNMLGLENLHKYPQDFIDWINEGDTWAETYVLKYKLNKIIDLFDLWVNEKY